MARCDAGRELAWRGGAPLFPALAWGEHAFTLDASGEGTTLTHGENFGALLALPLRLRRIHGRVTRSYEAMNLALKAHAEKL